MEKLRNIPKGEEKENQPKEKQSISRRNFLKTAALGTIGLGLSSRFSFAKSKKDIIEKANEQETLKNILNELDYTQIDSLDIRLLPSFFSKLKEYETKGLVEKSDITNKIIPSMEQVLSIFFSDKFFNGEFKNRVNIYKKERRQDAFAEFYQEVFNSGNTARRFAEKHQEVFSEFVKVFGNGIDLTEESVVFLGMNSSNLPPSKKLLKNHQDAIDIFFENVEKKGEEEFGPEILAAQSGIVVAVGKKWEGGIKLTEYKKGGISPTAGNGVIIFNPTNREYHYYAHLSVVAVKKGDIIKAGTIIGQGGNTGVNARKKGRGKHLHYEVHKDGKSIHVLELAKRIIKNNSIYIARK